MQRRARVAVLACLPMLVACSSSPGGEGGQAPHAAVDREGYGDAVAAIVTEAWAEKPEAASQVVLAFADGTWRAVPTAGIRQPRPSMIGTDLVVADTEGQVVIGPDRSRRIPRELPSDMGEWSGEAGDWHYSVFNVGTRGEQDGRYFFHVAAWNGGDTLVEGEIDQDVLAFAACGDRLHAVTGPWEQPGSTLSLSTVRVEDGDLVVGARPIDLAPRTTVRHSGAACVGDDLVLASSTRGVPGMLHVDLATARTRTVAVPDLEEAAYVQVVGSVAGEVLVDTGSEVVAITSDGRVSTLTERSEAAFDWRVAMDDGDLVVWEVEESDHLVRWVSGAGVEGRSVRLEGLQDHVAGAEQNVAGPPVGLGRP